MSFISKQLELPDFFRNIDDALMYSPNEEKTSSILQQARNYVLYAEGILRFWKTILQTSQLGITAETRKSGQSELIDLIVSCIPFACDEECHWVSQGTQKQADAVLLHLISGSTGQTENKTSAATAERVTVLLDDERLVKKLVATLRPLMRAGKSGADWKQNPAPRQIVAWVINHTADPLLADTFSDILPMILPLVDDSQIPNKVLGAKMLHRVVEAVPVAQLRVHSLLLLKVSSFALTCSLCLLLVSFIGFVVRLVNLVGRWALFTLSRRTPGPSEHPLRRRSCNRAYANACPQHSQPCRWAVCHE